MKQPKYLKSLLDQAYAVGIATAMATPDTLAKGGLHPLDALHYTAFDDPSFMALADGIKNEKAKLLAVHQATYGFYTGVNSRLNRENHDSGSLAMYNSLMNKYGWSV